MRLTCLVPDRTSPSNLREKDLSDWADWKRIYKQLLAEQRIWDFRDVLIEACVSYNTEQALSAFMDHSSPIEGMVRDWQTGTPDESTELALLDMLSFIAINNEKSLEDGSLAKDCLRLAEPIGSSLLDGSPHTVHSRPFSQWLVCQAVLKNGSERFAYLSDYAGLAICPKAAGVLPYYIPIRQENPGWMPPDLIPAARDVLETALEATRDMQDYQTETLCLIQLALGSKDPGPYFQQLGQLQKKQRDMAGFLRTCLTRYLICRDDESKQALLKDLNSFGSWKDASDLIFPPDAAARDVLQHALSRDQAKTTSLSIMTASRYSLYLPEPFKSIFRHLPRPQLTGTGEEPQSQAQASRIEQYSESEGEPRESPKDDIRSRNAHKNESRLGNKDDSNGHFLPAVPAVTPGPWTYYGIPPKYPMNMMHRVQPMHMMHSVQPPPPPPATEEEIPSPEMDQMKRQLELLLAERKQQEESKRLADIEQKIREDAERHFKLRREEMQKAQEEAKKEIELATIAAGRAARESLEDEKQAEAEQRAREERQRALMEAELRSQLEAALKAAEASAAEARAKREAEDAELRAEAVRAYEDKIAAEREAGEERRRREAELRAQGAREERERIEAERRVREEDIQGRRRSLP